MLSPRKVKYRKKQRGRLSGEAQKGNEISFGEYGLVSLETYFITARQIEAARVAMTRRVKRGGKVWIRIFPDVPYTKKPAETRMGKGKGGVDHWNAPVKLGTVMFEMAGVPRELAEAAMMLASSKLPVKTTFVVRRDLR
ncbi:MULTISPECIES: 50S ribosomal protein L16 [Borrelia]|uniref:Large ribosomal subunit protein uL16 n=3 Tax=Borrelia TaxID=138 RepID=RL16_BORT9|nr:MULTISPECIES: 50S ribosomal protein L16 [Borrelia]A1QZS1.1 RecName: Full=Large ribosomal subunit protein uL16; AltName: Full=50S ribosomal protein L16 [Borrelia turicatae 91E135]AAX17813.1 LSU ribosomal protein L16P [Borrelia turicatae 91E135]AHE62806.1 50S ribosomal protein L16 [Borrelia parkeri HR1]AHH09445.1 LSU ribosomal protein L16P [Borrelia parkeri SLO]ANF33952.1 50S ribosomal protein L16 [Borrelia turicatae]UPA10640.1 50S ribosomal protein L16 [Borrelia parkeri]